MSVPQNPYPRGVNRVLAHQAWQEGYDAAADRIERLEAQVAALLAIPDEAAMAVFTLVGYMPDYTDIKRRMAAVVEGER